MKHAAKGAVNRKKVNVRVVDAKGLLAADFNGKSDPFCQLKIRNRGLVKQTSTKMKTLNPVWGEEFEFEVVDEMNDYLDVTVYDYDKNGNNDFLGICSVPIAAVANMGRPLDNHFPLLDRHAASKTHSKKERGKVHLILTYTDQNGVTHTGTATAQPIAAAPPGAAASPGHAPPPQYPHQAQPMPGAAYPGQMMGTPHMMQPQMMQPQMMGQPMMMQPQMMGQPMMMQPQMMGQPMMMQPGMMQPQMMQPGMPMMMQPGMPMMQQPLGQYPPPGGQYPPPGGQYPPPQGGY